MKRLVILSLSLGLLVAVLLSGGVDARSSAERPGWAGSGLAPAEPTPTPGRTIRITNNCTCTLAGDVSTSEPWVWGPVGTITVCPGESAAFDVEFVARKVAFPGVSRVVFVSKQWTGVVPVKITGYEAKRRKPPSSSAAYVPPRRRRAVRTR